MKKLETMNKDPKLATLAFRLTTEGMRQVNTAGRRLHSMLIKRSIYLEDADILELMGKELGTTWTALELHVESGGTYSAPFILERLRELERKGYVKQVK